MARPTIVNKEKILENALNLYWKKGINNVSVYEIAKYSSVSRAAIYREFLNVDNLHYECIKAYDELVTIPLSNAFLNCENAPKLVSELMYDQIHNKKDKLYPYCLFYTSVVAQASLDKKTQALIKRIYNKLIKSIETAVNVSKNKGFIPRTSNSTKVAEYINNQLLLTITLDRAKQPQKVLCNLAETMDKTLKNVSL